MSPFHRPMPILAPIACCHGNYSLTPEDGKDWRGMMIVICTELVQVEGIFVILEIKNGKKSNDTFFSCEFINGSQFEQSTF